MGGGQEGERFRRWPTVIQTWVGAHRSRAFNIREMAARQRALVWVWNSRIPGRDSRSVLSRLRRRQLCWLSSGFGERAGFLIE